jgi:hypothetical protein
VGTFRRTRQGGRVLTAPAYGYIHSTVTPGIPRRVRARLPGWFSYGLRCAAGEYRCAAGLHVVLPLFQIGGGSVIAVRERPAGDMRNPRPTPHHPGDTARPVPDVIQGGKTSEDSRKRGCRQGLDQGVRFRSMRLVVQDELEPPLEFNSDDGLMDRKSRLAGGRRRSSLLEAVRLPPLPALHNANAR